MQISAFQVILYSILNIFHNLHKNSSQSWLLFLVGLEVDEMKIFIRICYTGHNYSQRSTYANKSTLPSKENLLYQVKEK